jgi:hypothetical protein
MMLKATKAALLVVAGLSGWAQAETLALRCEGTKTTTPFPLGKEPDQLKSLSQNLGDDEEPNIPNTPKKIAVFYGRNSHRPEGLCLRRRVRDRVYK